MNNHTPKWTHYPDEISPEFASIDEAPEEGALFGSQIVPSMWIPTDIARRIAACHNACDLLNTEALEGESIADLIRELYFIAASYRDVVYNWQSQADAAYKDIYESEINSITQLMDRAFSLFVPPSEQDNGE